MRNYKVTPWSYRKGTTLLHKLPAGLKLIFLLLLSLAVFFTGPQFRGFVILGAISLILIILSFAARIGPLALLRGSRPLLLIVLAVFVIQGVEFSPLGFSHEGLLSALIYCLRIALAFSSGALLFAVTTSGEIKKSITRLESFLHVEKLRLGLHFSLMLGFLPRFFEIWEELNLAYKSRSGKGLLPRLVTIIPILIERMMRKAAETASAMESRGALL